MKTVLITGASSGIGRYTAYQFAKNEYSLILTFHNDKSEIEITRKQCFEYGAANVEIFQLDLSDDKSIAKVVAILKKKKISINVLINNSATIVWKTLDQQTTSEIQSQIRTNLEGTITFTKALLPVIKSVIINIGSKMGKFARPDLPVYCATKFGLRGFTQALALSQPSLLVYCVNPDLTATKMTKYKGRNPEEIASIIFKLISGEQKPISGTDIDA